MLVVRALVAVACASGLRGLPLYDTDYPMFNVSQGVPVDKKGALFPHYHKDDLVAPYACDAFAWKTDNFAFVIKFGYIRALSWAVLPELNKTRCYLWVDINEEHMKSNLRMMGDQAKLKGSPVEWEAYVPGAGKGPLNAFFDLNTDLRLQWGTHVTLWGDECYNVKGQPGNLHYPVRCAFPRVVKTAPTPDPVVERTWAQTADCSDAQDAHDFAEGVINGGAEACVGLAKEVALNTDPLRLRVTAAQLKRDAKSTASARCRVFFDVLHTETRDWMMGRPPDEDYLPVPSTLSKWERIVYSKKPVRGAGFAVSKGVGYSSTCYTNDACLYPRTIDRSCNMAGVARPVQPLLRWVRKAGKLVSAQTEKLPSVTFAGVSASLQDCVDTGRKMAWMNMIRTDTLTNIRRSGDRRNLTVVGVVHSWVGVKWLCSVVVRDIAQAGYWTDGEKLETDLTNTRSRDNLVTRFLADAQGLEAKNATTVYRDECFYPYPWAGLADKQADACYLPPRSADSDVWAPCDLPYGCPLPEHLILPPAPVPPLCTCITRMTGTPDWFCASHLDQLCYTVSEFKLCDPGFVRCRNPRLAEADFVQRTTSEACTCGNYSGDATPLDQTVCTDGTACSLPYNDGTCSVGTLCSRNKIMRVTIEPKQAIPSSLIGGLVAGALEVSADHVEVVTACPAAACDTACPASIDARVAHGCQSFYRTEKDTSRSASTLGGEKVHGKVLIDFDLLLREPMRTDALVKLQENAYMFASGSTASLSTEQADAMRRLGLQQAVPVMRPVLRNAGSPPGAVEASTGQPSWWEEHVYLVALVLTLFLILIGVVVKKRVRFAEMVDFGASRLGERRSRLQPGMHGCYRRHRQCSSKKAAYIDALNQMPERSIDDSDSSDEVCVDGSDPVPATCQLSPPCCAESRVAVAPRCLNGSSVDLSMSMRLGTGIGTGMGMGMGMELSSSLTEGVEMVTI
eukprot:Rhum_TRINITY_DN22964_c0_g1::Rhum_TRINITY_DN22964_c0_g1_i1::g.176657::m.176657